MKRSVTLRKWLQMMVLAFPLKRLPIAFVVVCLLPFGLTACSEQDDTVEEFANWQEVNEQYFSSLYAQTQQRIASGDSSWKIIRKWSLPETSHPEIDNYIVVQVLSEGQGEGCPLYTDSVRCMYEGRLIPSTNYSSGWVFNCSFAGTFDPSTATAAQFAVSDVVDGFSTALQNMRIGDHWKVYIPYNLGYGTKDNKDKTTGSVIVPAYSTLVFDVTLVSYHRAGASQPPFMVKAANW